MLRRRNPVDPATRAAIVGTALGRIGIGAAIWASAARALRALGFEAAGPGVETMARLAASRDIALGALQLASLPSRERSRAAAGAAAAVDAGDCLAFALGLARGGERRAGVVGLGAAGAGALAGAWVVRRLG
ncbi:MAG TPA: hypothetical protein VK919_00980 [Solirubrobacterales bacterium]|nr:hypothetical protein [Solirubrobacterales bacterium]